VLREPQANGIKLHLVSPAVELTPVRMNRYEEWEPRVPPEPLGAMVSDEPIWPAGQRERKSAQNILDNPAFSDRVKQAVEQNKTYAPQSMGEASRQAKAIYDESPSLGAAFDRFKNDHTINAGVRMAGLIDSMKYISEAQRNLPADQAGKLNALSDELTKTAMEAGTEHGQAVVQMKALQSPAKWVYDYQKPIVQAQADEAAKIPEVGKMEKILRGGSDQAVKGVIDQKGKLLDLVGRARDSEQGAVRVKASQDIWTQYGNAIGKSVEAMAERMPPREKGQLEQFAQAVRETVQAKARETLPAKQMEELSKRTATETMRDLVQNIPEVQKAFDTAREAVKGNPQLEAFVNSTLDRPFSDTQLRRYVGESGVDLKSLVRQHYSEVDTAGQSLAERLVADGGLDKATADQVSGSVERGVKSLIGTERQRQLEMLLNKANPKAKQADVKTAADKMIEMSNLGAFDKEKFYNAIAKPLNLPAWDPDTAASIRSRAEAIQQLPEGSRMRALATSDLIDYARNELPLNAQHLIASIQTGNMLSGAGTHTYVPLATAIEANSNIALMMMARPKWAPEMLHTYINALWGKDGVMSSITMDEARALMNGDFSSLQGRDAAYSGQVSSMFERINKAYQNEQPVRAEMFGKTLTLPDWAVGKYGPLRAMRVIGRMLAAEHGMFKYAAVEVRAIRGIMDKVAAEKPATEADFNLRVAQEMGTDDATAQRAQSQARAEAIKYGMSESQERLRAMDIARAARDPAIQAQADAFGRRVTSSEDFKGMGGFLGEQLQRVTTAWPLLNMAGIKFLRTSTNVLNNFLNWVPVWSAKRLIWGKGASLAGGRYDKYYEPPGKIGSPEWDVQLGKTIYAHLITGGLVGLAQAFVKDKDPAFSVIGDGPQDYGVKNEFLQNHGKTDSFKIGSYYTSFKMLPGAAIFHAIGNLMDSQRYGGTPISGAGDLAGRTAMAVMTIPFSVANLEMLQGVSQLGDMVQGLAGKGLEDKAAQKAVQRWGESVASSFVPGDAAAKDIQSLMANPREADSALQHFIRSIPVASLALNPQLDVFGHPVIETPLEYIPAMHRFADKEAPDPVTHFIIRNGISIKWPETARVYVFDKTGKMVPREMTTAEHYQWVQKGGPAIYRTLQQGLPYLSRLPADEAKKEVESTIREYQDAAASAIEHGLVHTRAPKQ
jgi:hypothetical protein